MNYHKIMLLSALYLFSCTGYHSINKSNAEVPMPSPISIFNIEASLIDTTYRITGFTRRSVIKRIENFVYEVIISINVSDLSAWWDSPFEVILILPNEEIVYYILNEEEFVLRSSFIEDFKLIVETPHKGRAKCALSLIDHHQVDEFRLTDYDWRYVNIY